MFNRSAPKDSAIPQEPIVADVSTKARVAEKSNVANDDDGPVVQMVTSLVGQGLRDRASDIHIEPLNDILRIRYRIDGNLVEAQKLPLHMHSRSHSPGRTQENHVITVRREHTPRQRKHGTRSPL